VFKALSKVISSFFHSLYEAWLASAFSLSIAVPTKDSPYGLVIGFELPCKSSTGFLTAISISKDSLNDLYLLLLRKLPFPTPTRLVFDV
jgi:hypothetical protein